MVVLQAKDLGCKQEDFYKVFDQDNCYKINTSFRGTATRADYYEMIQNSGKRTGLSLDDSTDLDKKRRFKGFSKLIIEVAKNFRIKKSKNDFQSKND